MKSWSQKSRLPERKRQTILVTILIQTVRTCTCILHARILHTARSLVFVLPDADDAAGAKRLEPGKRTARERADANNTGDDSDSSEDLNDFQVPRPSLINTKPHAAILIGRRE